MANKKVSDKDYLFISSMLKARENRMLRRDRLEQMLSSAYTDAEMVKKVATGEEYAVAVPKDNPELLKAINAAIKTLQENGTIDDLTARFLG